jgi:hypothetical protein
MTTQYSLGVRYLYMTLQITPCVGLHLLGVLSSTDLGRFPTLGK